MFNVFQKTKTEDVLSNQIVKKPKETFTKLKILKENDLMFLYENFEIIICRPASEKSKDCYSLYRAQDQDDALEKFEAFIHRIPEFVQIVKDMFGSVGLQKICDILIENKSWSIAHLIAYFNLAEHVSNTAVMEFLNFQEPVKNLTPFHVACLSNNIECVNALLCAGVDVNVSSGCESNPKSNLETEAGSIAEYVKTNGLKKFCTKDIRNGGTPLHWCETREMTEEMLKRGCGVDALDFFGRSALHVMASKNKLDCVVTLLINGANIDFKDIAGNTALHIAVEKKLVSMVQCLVVFGCDVNITNTRDQTARHMVGNDNTGCDEVGMVLYILDSVGAKRCLESCGDCPPGCNFNDDYSGIPPYHSETTDKREKINQLLTSTMQMNLSIDKIVQLPKDQQKLVDTTNEKKISLIMDELLGMFATKLHENGTIRDEKISSPAPIRTPHKGRLLCLDGGGIRGLVLTQMLLEIVEIADVPITDLFDWIAGTSTGGILALALGCGKNMRECLCLYLKMKDGAFTGSRPYDNEGFEKVLKDSFGESTVMSDIKHPKIMVPAVQADRKPADMHLFRNYASPGEILGIDMSPSCEKRTIAPPPESQLVWETARSTGAAPSYFRAYGRFLDGGLIANNPTLDAMTEIHEYNMALHSVGRKSEAIPLSVVVSLGTGMPPVIEQKEIDIFRPAGLMDMQRSVSGIMSILNLLVDQATLSDGRVVDRARAWCSMNGISYFRFNPQLSEDLAMDEKLEAPLVNMMWETKSYMHKNRDKIIEMVKFLKQ